MAFFAARLNRRSASCPTSEPRTAPGAAPTPPNPPIIPTNVSLVYAVFTGVQNLFVVPPPYVWQVWIRLFPVRDITQNTCILYIVSVNKEEHSNVRYKNVTVIWPIRSFGIWRLYCNCPSSVQLCVSVSSTLTFYWYSLDVI